MSALMSRRPHSPVAARVRRIAAVLAAAGAGLLAWVAAVPAASAAPIPYPFGNGATSPAPHSVIRVVQGGGMPGWQIAAIAVAAALAAAVAAVFLDRAWSSHHPAHTA
jgi:hypothetical protein